MSNFNENLLISAARIDGLILDVDGVLTDGKITYNNKGEESKNFHVRDGSSIKLLLNNGIDIEIVSGRSSQLVEKRAAELGITKIVLGADLIVVFDECTPFNVDKNYTYNYYFSFYIWFASFCICEKLCKK